MQRICPWMNIFAYNHGVHVVCCTQHEPFEQLLRACWEADHAAHSTPAARCRGRRQSDARTARIAAHPPCRSEETGGRDHCARDATDASVRQLHLAGCFESRPSPQGYMSCNVVTCVLPLSISHLLSLPLSLSHSLFVSLPLSLKLFLCNVVCLSACPYIDTSVCLHVCLCVCVSLSLSLYVGAHRYLCAHTHTLYHKYSYYVGLLHVDDCTI